MNTISSPIRDLGWLLNKKAETDLSPDAVYSTEEYTWVPSSFQKYQRIGNLKWVEVVWNYPFDIPAWLCIITRDECHSTNFKWSAFH